MTPRAPSLPSGGSEPAFVLPEARGKSAAFLAIVLPTFAILAFPSFESFGFVATALTGLLDMLVLILGVSLIASGALRSKQQHLRIGAALLVGAVAAIGTSNPINRSKQERSKATGDAVCAALDAWHNRHGRYPETLQELVPELLPNVPTSAMGLWSTIPFRYRRDASGDDYSLAFDSPAWIVCERGRRRPWRCDD